MSELELFNFLKDDSKVEEYRWSKDEFLVWIKFEALEEFTEMIDYDATHGEGTKSFLQEGCICLDLNPIAKYEGIKLENILKKEV
jgi:hypothetical protein